MREIPDTALEQLEEIRETGEVDLNNRLGVQAVAHERGLTDLAMFIADADAVAYYKALEDLPGYTI